MRMDRHGGGSRAIKGSPQSAAAQSGLRRSLRARCEDGGGQAQAALEAGRPLAAGPPGAPAALGLPRDAGELPEEVVELHGHPTGHGAVLRHRLLRDEDPQPAGARDHA